MGSHAAQQRRRKGFPEPRVPQERPLFKGPEPEERRGQGIPGDAYELVLRQIHHPVDTAHQRAKKPAVGGAVPAQNLDRPVEGVVAEG